MAGVADIKIQSGFHLMPLKFITCLFAAVTIATTDAHGKIRCSEESFCIEVIDTNNTKEFYGINKKDYFITAEIDLSLTNMEIVDPKEPLYEIKPRSKEYLFSIEHMSEQRGSYKFKYTWNKGSHTAIHSTTAVYQPPYYKIGRYRVSQSCNGGRTHNRPHSMYAIDFAMPEGTPVLAARSGKVVDLYEFSIMGGTTRLDYRFSNYVLIQHDDLTLAGYYHLKAMGVSASIGQHIKAGERIGFSGNTGYSSGPHLHFVVFKPITGKHSTSLQTTFRTGRGDVICPPRGAIL